MQVLLVVGVLLVLVPLLRTEGAKVLLLPMVGTSHIMNFAQIGEALLKNGHQVTAYINGDCKSRKHLSKVNVELITYTNTVSGCFMEAEHWVTALKDLLEDGEIKSLKLIRILYGKYILFKAEVEHALSDQEAIDKMKRMDFDVIVIDGFLFNKHLYAMAHILDKPIVTVVTIFGPYEAGVPTIPSIYPFITSNTGFTAKMTFSERLTNLGAIIATRFVIPFLLPPCDDNLVNKFASDRPYMSLAQIAGHSRVWLVMSDEIIDYAKVTVPSIINIGGFNTKPIDPLTGDFKAWADSANSGLIIVSFGSQLIIPKRLIKVLMESFRGLPQTVIMRHTDMSVENVPANLHFVKWMPQNDLLGHPNTCLFITHGGCNGQFEALYHGVPTIGLPMIADQLYNSRRAEYHGIGITLKLATLTPLELTNGVKKILGDPAYSTRASYLSEVFRDRPMTPMETTMYWIERVAKYGCEELRPASVDLPFYQFWALDIMAFCIVILCVLMFVAWKLLGCFLWLCCSKKSTFSKVFWENTQKLKAKSKSA